MKDNFIKKENVIKSEKDKQNDLESEKRTFLKSKKYGLFSLICIIVIIVLIVSGLAYARYITTLRGQTNTEIAKWTFKVIDGIPETSDVIDFAVTRTDNNSKVDQGMLAPRNLWKISN